MSENNLNQQNQSQPQQMQQAQQPQSTQQQNNNNNQNQDLANCDLANLESLNCNDSDELLRQLTENTFELETFFSEFSTADIKVSKGLGNHCKYNKTLINCRRKITTKLSTPPITINKTILQIATTSTSKLIWRFYKIGCWHQHPVNMGLIL